MRIFYYLFENEVEVEMKKDYGYNDQLSIKYIVLSISKTLQVVDSFGLGSESFLRLFQIHCNHFSSKFEIKMVL